MKLYVDELPRSCGDCVFLKETEYCYYCDKLHTKLGYINKEKDCPLQPLADYTKQVRKEVCEEIWKRFEQRLMNKTEDMPLINVANMINSVLDQIQGETKC